MKKQSITILLVVLLLLVNLGTMAFFWMVPQGEREKRSPAPDRRRAEVVEFFNKELQLTEEQQEEFRELRADFFERSRDIRREIRAARRGFYEHITNNNEEEAEGRAALIARKQKELEMNTFYHFRELRNRLNEEQQERFDEVMKEMLNARWMDGPRRGRGQRQNRER